MRDYKNELIRRVDFIRQMILTSNSNGIVYGNSGGKDSTLVGILCKIACENTIGIIMPCGSKSNYSQDKEDALIIAKQFDIETRFVDLTDVRNTLIKATNEVVKITEAAHSNIAPRLRMTTIYMVAASENRLVAGTGNRSESYMGYFTKWGDGAYDFNPIADLTVKEVLEFLSFLNAPVSIVEKAPSAGLYDGQTDEKEMGVSYKSIDKFLLEGTTNEKDMLIIENYHNKSKHKRDLPYCLV